MDLLSDVRTPGISVRVIARRILKLPRIAAQKDDCERLMV
jgi:hypothetical protein